MCANPGVGKDRAVFGERDSGREETSLCSSVSLRQNSPAGSPPQSRPSQHPLGAPGPGQCPGDSADALLGLSCPKQSTHQGSRELSLVPPWESTPSSLLKTPARGQLGGGGNGLQHPVRAGQSPGQVVRAPHPTAMRIIHSLIH